ncbi:hypothetical protein Pogu_1389 [Pyrobaculum oguniense TE7]|uniref:Uncharacterized protein n=1 Tax=Pyrobaculum oguniense (strain DSM 13380 / JCM 10595 / TE7) TaxID=698757 RepID=H6Q935_PYROT|nr:hypothetical protein Pogu_1389 [Pyrobaculum oguniense TE7]
MKASMILAVILVVALAAVAALYSQEVQKASSLEQQIKELEQKVKSYESRFSELSNTISTLQNEIKARDQQIQQLQDQLAKAAQRIPGLIYALIREGREPYVLVIDPNTNNIVAKIALRFTFSPELFKVVNATLFRAPSPSRFEVWTPRYWVPDIPYLIFLFEHPNGSFVAFIDRATFRDVAVIKTYEKYTRQYGGITPDGRYLIISQRQAQRVVFIDLEKREIIKVVNVDANPCDAAPSPDGKYVFIPVRSDQDPKKPEYGLVLEVPTGREVARYYFKKPGEETYTEPSMTYWSYYKPEYGILQGEARPYEAVFKFDLAGGKIDLIKEVSYPSTPYMAIENPAREEVAVVVYEFGIYVRSLPPEYRVLKEVKLVPDYVKATEQGTYSQDGRYFYLAGTGGGGLVILDTSTWTVVKHIKADAAVWVIAVPSGEWLKHWKK